MDDPSGHPFLNPSSGLCTPLLPFFIVPLFVVPCIASVHTFCSINHDPSYRVRHAIYTRFE